MATAPIFIIGTERSGSNLLRLILNAHSHICVPHPPHIVRYFSPLERCYGDLNDDARMRRLIHQVLRLVQWHIHPWDVVLDPEAILRTARPRNVFGVYAACYDQYLAASGKRRWACKSTFMIDHAPAILARYPDARLIWLVRDPRDVAVSSQQSVFNPFHPCFTARLWARQQRIGLDLEHSTIAGQVFRLHYESLIAAPEGAVPQLCQFLDEPFEAGMLRYFDTEDARSGSRLSESWRNVGLPILSKNAGKYRKQLSQHDIRLVEAEAGAVMASLGYDLDFPAMPQVNVTAGRLLWYRLLGLWARLRVELRSLRRDRNHWRRWRRDGYMTWLTLRCRLRGLLQ